MMRLSTIHEAKRKRFSSRYAKRDIKWTKEMKTKNPKNAETSRDKNVSRPATNRDRDF